MRLPFLNRDCKDTNDPWHLRSCTRKGVMFSMFRKEYDTLNLKWPRKCCQWCTEQTQGLDRNLKEVEERLAELDHNVAYDRSLAITKLKMEGALQLFNHAVNAEARRGFWITNGTTLVQVFAAAYRAVETAIRTARDDDWIKAPIKDAGAFEATVNGTRIPETAASKNGSRSALG